MWQGSQRSMGWTSTYNESIIIPLLPLNCNRFTDRDYHQHLTHTVSTLHTHSAPHTYSQHPTHTVSTPHTVSIPHIQSASHIYSQHPTHTVSIPHIQSAPYTLWSASHTIPVTLQPPNKWLPNGWNSKVNYDFLWFKALTSVVALNDKINTWYWLKWYLSMKLLIMTSLWNCFQ